VKIQGATLRYSVDLVARLRQSQLPHSAESIRLPLLILETQTLLWTDEQACAVTAQKMAARPALRDAIIELEGPLGAGKTSFVRHLLRAAGVTGRVKSPSFAVVEAYSIVSDAVEWRAWHFDFYRFNDAQEWEDAGFRDVFAESGLKLIEWPDKARALLPQADIAIRIAILSNDTREAEVVAYTARGQELLS
jgi:tRNA threonylcarbamoyladenosine biosynthesis protein TsaE